MAIKIIIQTRTTTANVTIVCNLIEILSVIFFKLTIVFVLISQTITVGLDTTMETIASTVKEWEVEIIAALHHRWALHLNLNLRIMLHLHNT